MRVEEISVDWLGPSFNKMYAGIHWARRKKIADEAHDAVKVAAIGVEPFNKPVHLSFTPLYSKRAFDISNYALTVKTIEDGLVRAGIIPDDTNKWVRSITIHCPQKKAASSVLVKIEEATPQPYQDSLPLKQ